VAPLDPDVRLIQRRLREQTPFWAGGVYRGPGGEWVFPGPKDFQGVAKILNKQARSVPAIAHPWQLEFDDLLEAQRAKGLPMRGIVLKSRKLGFSTWIALKFLQRLTQMEYQRAIVTAQDTKTARAIFNMAKHAYSHLPDEVSLGLGFSIKPHLVGANFGVTSRTYMEFGEPSRKLRMAGRTGNSTLEIDTAKSPEAGRGETPTMLHLSEAARWPAEQIEGKMVSLLNAMPYEPETIVLIESTPNGRNDFYHRYMGAKEGAADPSKGEMYFALFVPWWRDDRCQMTFATGEDRERFALTVGDEAREGEVAKDEPELIELYGLQSEQLLWRRAKVRELKGNLLKFKEEFPANDVECFIGSGQTYFSGVLISRAIKATEDAPRPVKGTLRVERYEEKRSPSGTIEVPRSVLWVPESDMQAGEHELVVWEHPRLAAPERILPPARPMPTAASPAYLLEEAAARAAEEQADAAPVEGPGAYVVAVDVAGGEVDTFGEGDYHCVQVFDHHTHKQVAVHASRMDKAHLPLWALMVALYFNDARLAIEINGPGSGIIDTLNKAYRYRRLWKRQQVGTGVDRPEKKPGWETNKPMKVAMETTFEDALMEADPDDHFLRDPFTARELSSYVVDEKGRHGAEHGEHDDRLMAAMIALQVITMKRPPRLPGERRSAVLPARNVTGWPPRPA
jgi:hypothetical protein